ncbi:MAG: tRNA (adenosine(37)-N6)-dimethylallyltransferase MiaA [Alphaproteobacteria bacterium]|nr:tRNA (adenosine(37)-N6)-dimethylallyltransferase MiaA [Alphaproteobacteria bacterium]
MPAVQNVATQNVIVIGGPTASGKSGLALDVARTRGGVIINADSMQVYAGLPILTAQPPAEDLAAAPHRLYGTLPPADVCSAARWRDMAMDEIDAARAQNSLPVIVGGTGFYIRALTEGLSPMPAVPEEIRHRLGTEIAAAGNSAFHARLAACDPVMAAKLHPGNTQRLVRAMEILEHTGKSLAYWQSLPPVPPPAHLRFIKIALLPPRDWLYARCDERFSHMLAHGGIEEARAFPSPKGDHSWPLHKALGYPELRAFIDGRASQSEAVAEAQQSTRHYAKRQITWFRHQMKADIVLDAPDAAQLDGAF